MSQLKQMFLSFFKPRFSQIWKREKLIAKKETAQIEYSDRGFRIELFFT